MSNKLSNTKTDAPVINTPEQTVIKEFKLHVVQDSHQGIMALMFFVAAFVIYFQIRVTLIEFLEASQLLVLFGLIGFGISFLVRKRCGLSLLDGLYYNVFTIAPVSMALFFIINGLCSNQYEEVHRVVNYSYDDNGLVYELENDAYSEFWRIRHHPVESKNLRNPSITFTFCDGLLGYKVLKNTELE
jgi:hypothetical protein